MITDQKTQPREDLLLFHETDYGKLALSKFGAIPENFFIYCCSWLGDIQTEGCVMEVTGCEFRAAKAGRHKGKYSIAVKGTERKVYLTSAEVRGTI